MTRKDDNFFPYALVSLLTCLPTHLSPYALDSTLSTQLEGISGCENYLGFVHLSRNEIIISQTSLDSVESEQSVGRN